MGGGSRDGGVPRTRSGSRNWGSSPAAFPATPHLLIWTKPRPLILYDKATPPISPAPSALAPLRVCAARCPLSPLGRRRRRGARGGRGRRVGKMAEASPQPGRFFCHCCSAEIAPRLPVSGGPRRGGEEGRERGQGRAAAPRGRARGGEA